METQTTQEKKAPKPSLHWSVYVAIVIGVVVILSIGSSVLFTVYKRLTRTTQDLPDPTNWQAMYNANISVGNPLGRDYGY